MRQSANNTFKDGLNLDLHPIVTPNTVLTDNLNGTFITYNGNEFCLQNDKGNILISSLKEDEEEHFVPIGAKEYNGVIYIASYCKGTFELGTFPSLPQNAVEETVYNLVDEYRPLKIINGYDFSVNGVFEYDEEHPVTIEIQPSYDGSVNLILVANECVPRIFNSGFSVLPNKQGKLIKRNTEDSTNNYDIETLFEDTKLIRSTNILTNIDLLGVQSGGQWKGGNYTFYIKFGDADYNQTDVVAESGIVSIFNGNDGVPSTISGTLADERTDKMICLGIEGLNRVYSKLYIYYTREYSDTNGFRMTESGMLIEPIDMKPDDGKDNYQTIWLTGFEATQSISVEELNVDYHTIDSARAEAQNANMLFLGNIQQTQTNDLYRALEEICLKNISVVPTQENKITNAGYDYDISNSEYYTTNNIYNYLGYWPEEMYRFGIVFILKDGSKTPVFNIPGGYYVKDNDKYKFNKTNESGVYLIPDYEIYQEDGIYPIGMKFSWDSNTPFPKDVLGWFVVRQKRIPNTICQGLSIAVDKKSYTPIIWDGENWITQSFLSLNRDSAVNAKNSEIHNEEWRPLLVYNNISDEDARRSGRRYNDGISSTVRRTSRQDGLGGSSSRTSSSSSESERPIGFKIMKEGITPDFAESVTDWKSSDALLSLDPCVVPTIASMLDGSQFSIVKYKNIDSPNIAGLRYAYPIKQNTTNELSGVETVFVPSNTQIKMIGDVGFSTVAGNAASVKEYKFFSTPLFITEREIRPQIDNERLDIQATNNVNLIRGLFAPYIGLNLNKDEFRGIYSIKNKSQLDGTKDSNDIIVRNQDNSEFYCVSDYSELTDKITVYRGDCFTNTVTMRIIRNFVDPEVPSNETIVDEKNWDKYVKRAKNETEEDKDSKPIDWSNVNRADVNTVDLGLWVTYKCLSSYNLGLRSIDTFNTDEMALMGTARSFFPLNGASTATGNKVEESFLLNDGLSATVGRKRYNLLPDNPYNKNEFANRIMFSNVNVTDSFTNGYRTFQGLSYQDYDKQYGAITKLISWGTNLFVVMEHGLALVPVNEKALMQTTTGETIHIYGHGVLPDQMTIISQDFGSKYEHSVIRTPIGIYGIDTDAKKIWRFSDKNGFETLSDMKIETYLQDNLFTDESVYMELCDVRTHYNALKGDVMFTFYNKAKPEKEPYFVIKTDDVTVGVNKVYTIPYSTNKPISDIELEFGDLINCELKYGYLYITGLSIGSSTVIIDGNTINVTVVESEEPDVPYVPDPIEEDPEITIKFNIHSVTLEVMESKHIELDIMAGPDDVIEPDVISDNPRVVSVIKSDNGFDICALSDGQAKLSAVYNDKVYDTMNVYVNKKSLHFTDSSAVLYTNLEDKNTFVTTVLDSVGPITLNVEEDTVTATSDGTTITIVATVPCDTIVYVTDSNGTTGEIHIVAEEYVHVESISFNEQIPNPIMLKVGQAIAFGYKVIPENCTKYFISTVVSDGQIIDKTSVTSTHTVGNKEEDPFIAFLAKSPGEATCELTLYGEDATDIVETYTFNIVVSDE